MAAPFSLELLSTEFTKTNQKIYLLEKPKTL